jgi:hypothetical protein
MRSEYVFDSRSTKDITPIDRLNQSSLGSESDVLRLTSDLRHLISVLFGYYFVYAIGVRIRLARYEQRRAD